MSETVTLKVPQDWKTTLIGLVSAIAIVGANYLQAGEFTWPGLATAAFAAVIGFFAGDKGKKAVAAGLVLFALLLPSMVLAGYGPVNNTGLLSSSGLVYTGQAGITSCLVVTDGTNDATVIVYDNTTGSGTVVAKFVVAGSGQYGGGTWENPMPCNNGVYVSISGTGAAAIIGYIKSPSWK